MAKFFGLIAFASLLCVLSCEGKLSGRGENRASLNASPSAHPKKVKDDDAERNAHFNEALRLSQKLEYENAIAEMEKAVAIEPDKVSYRWLANWYSVLKKYEDEVKTYRKLIELDSSDPIDHWALAKLLVRQLKQFDEGIKEAKIAKNLYAVNNSYVLDQVIGEAYEGLGDSEKALAYYKLFLRGVSYAPMSDDYKNTKKKITDLEDKSKNNE
jgi:tetratricopeptide (TPR) repeat protein